MAITLPDTVTRLLDGRNFAHLASIMSDGSPHCAPVWVGREGDRIMICTDEVRSKAGTRAAIRGWPSPLLIWTTLQRGPASRASNGGKAWLYRKEAPVALVIEIDKAHYSKQPFEHTPIPAVRRPP
jgi:pyridoxamine 5'-phosphate oxidase-like protein